VEIPIIGNELHENRVKSRAAMIYVTDCWLFDGSSHQLGTWVIWRSDLRSQNWRDIQLCYPRIQPTENILEAAFPSRVLPSTTFRCNKDLTHTPFSLLKLESNELMIQPQPDLASLRKKTTIIPIRSPPACKRMMRCSEARVACMRLNGPGRHRRSPACMPWKPFLHAAAQ
jgi:hypothetical protein